MLQESPVSLIPSGSVFARIFSSNLAKHLASTVLNVGKLKYVGKKAVDVRKTAAIDARKRLVKKATKKLLTNSTVC